MDHLAMVRRFDRDYTIDSFPDITAAIFPIFFLFLFVLTCRDITHKNDKPPVPNGSTWHPSRNYHAIYDFPIISHR